MKDSPVGKVVCISCVKSKKPQRSQAGDLYTSALFKFSLMYAQSLEPSHIFVLSAKHGVLKLSDEVDPYEQTLMKMPKHDRLSWAEKVLSQLRQWADLDRDQFVFLAGTRYRENLVPHIRNWSVPMEGLRFGQQLQWLKQQVGQ